MKTETKSRIIDIIRSKGRIRPVELQKALNLSPQAIHRHLRMLVDQGLLETQGSPPVTRYALAGSPDFNELIDWIKAPSLAANPPSRVCETRERFAARLPHLKEFLRQGLPESRLPLVISTAGEIGNNSFDHNLGQWRDVPGCWFESRVSGRGLWIGIGDRGQGVFNSLVKVDPALADDQAALKTAFEKVLSGRAPEKRGNGLKYVRKNLEDAPGGGLACRSGTGSVFYGREGEACAALLEKRVTNVKGTLTLMRWSLQ